MNILDNCKQTIIAAYNQCIEFTQKNNVHIFVWSWNHYSTKDLYQYETLDQYLDANCKFKHTDEKNDLTQIDCFITCLFNPYDNGALVTEEELNEERKNFAAKRAELISTYGSFESLQEKIANAKKQSDAAFDAWHKLNVIARGY